MSEYNVEKMTNNTMVDELIEYVKNNFDAINESFVFKEIISDYRSKSIEEVDVEIGKIDDVFLSLNLKKLEIEFIEKLKELKK